MNNTPKSDTPIVDSCEFSVTFAGKVIASKVARRLERERDEAREELARITSAAQAVVDRWELPAWKDAEPTAAVIYRLRDALEGNEKL